MEEGVKMSKCTDCNYESLPECEYPCNICRRSAEQGFLNSLGKIDHFEPKEEQPTTEYNGCHECYYEWLDELDAPCCECKHQFAPGTDARLKAKDYFKPKKQKGCDGCIYEQTEPYEEPCIVCQRNSIKGTKELEGRIDYFNHEEKEHSSNCTISVKECNKAFKNEDYGFENVDMVNHSQHYQHGIEPIDYIESHNLNFNLGNVIQYVSCAPFEGTELQDLKKAKWYLEREIDKYVD